MWQQNTKPSKIYSKSLYPNQRPWGPPESTNCCQISRWHIAFQYMLQVSIQVPMDELRFQWVKHCRILLLRGNVTKLLAEIKEGSTTLMKFVCILEGVRLPALWLQCIVIMLHAVQKQQDLAACSCAGNKGKRRKNNVLTRLEDFKGPLPQPMILKRISRQYRWATKSLSSRFVSWSRQDSAVPLPDEKALLKTPLLIMSWVMYFERPLTLTDSVMRSRTAASTWASKALTAPASPFPMEYAFATWVALSHSCAVGY